MKTLFIHFFFVAVITGCKSEIKPNYIKTNAKLINALAVDGCSWHFEVTVDNKIIYLAASNSSKDKLENVIKNSTSQFGVYTIDVEISYEIGSSNQCRVAGVKTKNLNQSTLMILKLLSKPLPYWASYSMISRLYWSDNQYN